MWDRIALARSLAQEDARLDLAVVVFDLGEHHASDRHLVGRRSVDLVWRHHPAAPQAPGDAVEVKLGEELRHLKRRGDDDPAVSALLTGEQIDELRTATGLTREGEWERLDPTSPAGIHAAARRTGAADDRWPTARRASTPKAVQFTNPPHTVYRSFQMTMYL